MYRPELILQDTSTHTIGIPEGLQNIVQYKGLLDGCKREGNRRPTH